METIGILGAIPEEVERVVGALEAPAQERYAGVAYHIGRRAGKRLVACCAGMGKVNAAQAAQVLVTRYGAEALIFSGIAGNLCAEIGVGDVVIGREAVYHDGEESMLVQSAPHTAAYAAAPFLVEAMEAACRQAGVRYVTGRIATGDRFVGDGATKRKIQEKCAPLCVEMEGAAVGQVAMRNGVPFVVVRAMSDEADVDIETLREREKTKEFDVGEYVKTASAIVVAAVDALA